jgi:hypothetical protein
MASLFNVNGDRFVTSFLFEPVGFPVNLGIKSLSQLSSAVFVAQPPSPASNTAFSTSWPVMLNVLRLAALVSWHETGETW